MICDCVKIAAAFLTKYVVFQHIDTGVFKKKANSRSYLATLETSETTEDVLERRDELEDVCPIGDAHLRTLIRTCCCCLVTSRGGRTESSFL